MLLNIRSGGNTFVTDKIQKFKYRSYGFQRPKLSRRQNNPDHFTQMAKITKTDFPIINIINHGGYSVHRTSAKNLYVQCHGLKQVHFDCFLCIC
jgi:hypothetical protein